MGDCALLSRDPEKEPLIENPLEAWGPRFKLSQGRLRNALNDLRRCSLQALDMYQ